MKRFKLLLMALAMFSFTAFYACGGGEVEGDAVEDVVEEVVEEPVVEEEVVATPDSTAVEVTDDEKTDGGE